MKLAVFSVLCCLLVLSVRGLTDGGSETCKCSNGFLGRVVLKHIRAGPFIHQPSVFCPRTEITIITTAGREKCVNPESPLGKIILKNSEKKKAAVSTTTSMAAMTATSSQTNAVTSSTTTKL